ncbi:MAG: bifunctional 4-hydroxy-2-oxoglutarate aldolase/2-dehydro-3-deoxy-phosphogluconate aldolase [Candidatus Odinarchaeota archaeon]
MDVYKKLKELKLIPVAVINDPDNAVPLGKVLIEAGLPLIEVAFRTEAAVQSIRNLSNQSPDLLIGAGTVLKVDHVKEVIKGGAKFIVTPGFNPKVVDYCLENKILIIPGVNTPTMVEWALDRGIKILKFFPANVSGGIEMLKSLEGPYPEIRFVPTGGINSENIIEYLKLQNVIACGGSWIVKKELISSRQFEEIKRLTENARTLIKSEFK